MFTITSEKFGEVTVPTAGLLYFEVYRIVQNDAIAYRVEQDAIGDAKNGWKYLGENFEVGYFD